ncbi:MAG: hypothetical protein M3377_08620 [Actinomycetota bacterium]|nr:hypothetical protein [Actinomycetota bacterium]
MTDSSAALRIRRFEDSDHDAVWALHNDALHHAGAHAGSGPWDDDLHAIRCVYHEQDGEFVVGMLDGELVAMGALRRSGPRRAEIKRMRVAHKSSDADSDAAYSSTSRPAPPSSATPTCTSTPPPSSSQPRPSIAITDTARPHANATLASS